jgi:GNAT superfamily N-acetyltransferase
MRTIISSDYEPQHLEVLRKWFLSEWEKVDPFTSANTCVIVPAPLIAIDGTTLLGGLAFTSHPIPNSPNSPNLGLWVNALIVSPEHRKKGIGSKLIKAAEVEAKNNNIEELFVYTNIPKLYNSLGWVELNKSGENTTLKKVLVNSNYT